jgi:hypothetical protein
MRYRLHVLLSRERSLTDLITALGGRQRVPNVC